MLFRKMSDDDYNRRIKKGSLDELVKRITDASGVSEEKVKEILPLFIQTLKYPTWKMYYKFYYVEELNIINTSFQLNRPYSRVEKGLMSLEKECVKFFIDHKDEIMNN